MYVLFVSGRPHVVRKSKRSKRKVQGTVIRRCIYAYQMLSGTMAREYAAAKMTDKDYKQSVSDYMKMKSPDRQKAPAPNLNSQTGRNQVKSALESSNNKKIANAAKNGEVTNGAILGTSGSGKTFTSHLFALRFRMRRIQTFILAPVKGERDYGNGCYRVGGQFVSMSPGSPNHINIMDIHAPDLSNIDSLGDDDASNAAQISLLAQKSRTILTFIKLQAPDLTLEEEQLVDGCVYETYGRFGITEDNMSIYKFGTSEYKEMPILEDLYNTMKNVPELRRVCNIFKPLISGSLSSFNNHTNVDLSNLYIVFDFDACDGKNKVMALFIVLDFCWSKIKEDSSKQKAIFIDEAWNLISKSSNEMCADFIKEIFKTIRAYNGAAFVMTQNASDFFTMNGGEYGRAIITNADTKIIMQLPETEIEILRTAVQLTDDECNKIQQLHRGSGLVIAGSSKLFADFTASDFEAEVISGDIKKSKR